ncbi:3-dehydroquinate synthase [Candidatus Hydrogenisulfobacillus filiaventi]|uniref:3-dehydroquinate synthase n=1 Tax=Candidatus Hydrogenisulfobacillus filiaventi TaxID=2707344 RepID=A0A6F8ZG62_9FIRM|nr:3-dehydroquinate synthase [Bacillota bacterium]CAB1128926.1 3-dehydroquinate synthase [Candidatus Hydrogenisulfobacillus filiaventi]
MEEYRWSLPGQFGPRTEVRLLPDTVLDARLEARLGEILAPYCQGRPVAVVADTHTLPMAERVTAGLAAVAEVRTTAVIPAGEPSKTWAQAGEVLRQLARAALPRDGVVLAVGGGVVTDLAGFVAATYLRGVRWVAVPTTLLAQVDAAVGGKTAVDLPEGKNLAGAFFLPELVLAAPAWLATLPVAEWRSGLGEVVKSALIAKSGLWNTLRAGLPEPGRELERWTPIIAGTIAVKAAVVAADPHEGGPRMALNFGHTLGHALETLIGYGRISHGEAVGLGSLVALYLSEQLWGLDPAVQAEVRHWLQAWGMPVRLDPAQAAAVADRAALAAVLNRDKKARAFGLQWTLLRAAGEPVISRDVPWELVWEAVETILPAETAAGRGKEAGA